MKLFGRGNSSDASAVPADLQQYYSPAGSGAMKWVIRIVAIVIILALLVWLGILIAHKASNHTASTATNKSTTSQQKSTTTKPNSSSSAPQTGSNSQPSTSTPQSANPAPSTSTPSAPSTTPAQGSTNQAPSSGQAPTSGGQGGGQLPNTGPGSVVALFAGATVLGAAAHLFVSRRRQLR